MNCLTNYIGLRGCSSETPESGIWLNDLPGMSNELLDSLATKDQVTYAGVWASVQRVVFEQIKATLRTKIREIGQVEMGEVLFYTKRNVIFERQVISPIAADPVYKGIYVSATGSRYLQLYLKSLWVYNSGSAVTGVPFKVFSTYDWTVKYETTVDLQPGMNTIAINQAFDPEFAGFNMFFALDTANVATIDNPFVSSDYAWGFSDCACANQGPNHYGWDFQNWVLYPAVMPLDVALPDKMNFDWSQSGVSVDLDLRCSVETFICRNRESLKMGLAYALAHQILLNKLAGFNQNFHATYNPEQTERNLVTFQNLRDEQFKEWAKVIQVQGEDMCFSCEEAEMIGMVGIRS